MMLDDYFKNQRLYKGIADRINADSGLQSSFKRALEQASTFTDFKKTIDFSKAFEMSGFESALSAVSAIKGQSANILELVSPVQAAMVGSALSAGFKFDGLEDNILSAYEPMLKQEMMLEKVQASVRELIDGNTAFASLLKTSLYVPGTALDSMTGITAELTTFQKAVELIDEIKLDGAKTALEQVGVTSGFAGASINVSWLNEDSRWRDALDTVARVSESL